jgi:membrane-associated phospholipid phosphatase
MPGRIHAEQRSDPTPAERLAWTAGVGAVWASGYFALGHTTGERVARSLATPFDALVPFLPWTVWVYLLGLVVILTPAFLPGGRESLRRTALAYYVVLAASFLCFWLYPVTSVGLRPDLERIVGDGSTAWALRQLYRIDPQYNLFPSLHVALGSVAVLSAWRVSRRGGAVMAAVAIAVAISVCTVKQHFAVDVVAGMGLGCAAAAIVFGLPGQTYAGDLGRSSVVGCDRDF